MNAAAAWHPGLRRRDRVMEAGGWILSCAFVTTALAGTLFWVERRTGAEAGLEAAIILELDPLPPVAAIPAPPPAPRASSVELPADLPDASEPISDMPSPETAPAPRPVSHLPERAIPDRPLLSLDPPPKAEAAEIADPDLAKARPRPRPETAEPARIAERFIDARSAQATGAISSLPQSAAASRLGIADAMAQWGAAIRKRVERRKAYPKAAQGAEGEVVVKMTISRAGALERVTVSRSSGNAVLDEAALSAVRRAGRFPAAPDALPEARHVFSLPIRFAP